MEPAIAMEPLTDDEKAKLDFLARNGITLQAAKPEPKMVSLATVARTDFDYRQVELLKRTIAKGATDDELALFLGQCRRTGLDPFAKQIYLVKRWDSKKQQEVMAIQVGIDGYRLIADRTGKYSGNDDPIFDSEAEPKKATVTVYKNIDGARCAFTATARWEQYYPGEKQGFMWKRMPHLMLGKCAEALALRKAFPAELSGLYIAEELDQITGNIEIEQSVTQDEVATLTALLTATSTDLARFLKWGECESLDQLPRSKFAAAVSMLGKKVSK